MRTEMPTNSRLIPASDGELSIILEHEKHAMLAAADESAHTGDVHRDAAVNSQYAHRLQSIDDLAEWHVDP